MMTVNSKMFNTAKESSSPLDSLADDQARVKDDGCHGRGE